MHYLLKEGSGMTVDLYEASDRAGGKVNTHIRDGYTIELGPESYLARKEVMTELAYEVGLGDTLVRNQTGQAYIYAKNKLSPVPKDRKSTRLNSSHVSSSYAVFCLKK